MLALLLLASGILMRLIPHAPNFTPVAAISLFGGVYLNRKHAILLPLSLMIISDIFIGLHDTVLFTWGSFVLIAVIGLWVRHHKSFGTILASNLISAVLFFVITNFGSWLSNLHMYPHTFQGLVSCYTLAIPFFRNTLLSCLVYSAVLFGLYEFVAARVKETRFARVLLTI